MKYKVTISTLFIAGQKYKRGDIVDVSENLALSLGTQLEPIVEGEKMKPRLTRKKVETKNEDW